MDVVLVSARGTADVPHWSRALAADVAARLGSEARCRWLCALGRDEVPPPAPARVEVLPVRGRVPAFRAVTARVGDLALDLELARTLRPLRAATVVHLGFGAPGSAVTLWLAERMGAAAIAAVRADEVLCHRGTLVDWRQDACLDFTDPQRCADCCCHAWQRGLSPLQAKLARWLRRFGPYSPFPNELAFRSRADVVLASLQLARVLVASPSERDQLAAAGVTGRSMQVVAGADARGPDAAAVLAEITAAQGQPVPVPGA